MNIKNIRGYVILASLVAAYFLYATFSGILYIESKVEKNTEAQEHRSGRSGHARFYHK